MKYNLNLGVILVQFFQKSAIFTPKMSKFIFKFFIDISTIIAILQ